MEKSNFIARFLCEPYLSLENVTSYIKTLVVD